MSPFLKKLRFKWFVTTNTMSYTNDYLKQVYNIYLNHNKIIHYRDGHPVFSMATPSLYSKPMANFFARTFYRTIQNKNIPNLMSFAINDDCDAACKHCSFFQGVDDKSRKTLTLEQCQKVIRDAQDLGVSMFNFVGGEPLLRKDLTDILKTVDKNLSTPIMFTNGSRLEKRAKELKQAGLDGLYVSIDSSSPKMHDAFRRKKGLFDEAMKGIRASLAAGLTTGISFTITPETFKAGEIDKMMEMAKKIGVHEVLIFDAMPTGRYKHRKDLIDNEEWAEEIIDATEKYNKDESYPGILVWAYTTSFRSTGCSCGTSYFYVSPYGDIMSCDFNHKVFGNVLEEPLFKIWDRLTSTKGFDSAKWGGCKIKDSKYREMNLVSDTTERIAEEVSDKCCGGGCS